MKAIAVTLVMALSLPLTVSGTAQAAPASPTPRSWKNSMVNGSALNKALGGRWKMTDWKLEEAASYPYTNEYMASVRIRPGNCQMSSFMATPQVASRAEYKGPLTQTYVRQSALVQTMRFGRTREAKRAIAGLRTFRSVCPRIRHSDTSYYAARERITPLSVASIGSGSTAWESDFVEFGDGPGWSQGAKIIAVRRGKRVTISAFIYEPRAIGDLVYPIPDYVPPVNKARALARVASGLR